MDGMTLCEVTFETKQTLHFRAYFCVMTRCTNNQYYFDNHDKMYKQPMTVLIIMTRWMYKQPMTVLIIMTRWMYKQPMTVLIIMTRCTNNRLFNDKMTVLIINTTYPEKRNIPMERIEIIFWQAILFSR
jgi:hypothetical protein